MMVDENPDIRQQDSAVGESPDAATDGGDKCGNAVGANTVSSSHSAVADGLSTLISSVMTAFDSRAEATARSQDQLTFALDRLTGELDKLLEDAPSPFIMQHAARISGVRKRVKSLNNVLKSIQRRIDNMDRMLSAGLAHGLARLYKTIIDVDLKVHNLNLYDHKFICSLRKNRKNMIDEAEVLSSCMEDHANSYNLSNLIRLF